MIGAEIIIKKVLNESRDSFSKAAKINVTTLTRWEKKKCQLSEIAKNRIITKYKIPIEYYEQVVKAIDELDFIEECKKIKSENETVYKVFVDASFCQKTGLATAGLACFAIQGKEKKTIFSDCRILENCNNSSDAEIEAIKIGIETIRKKLTNVYHSSQIHLLNDCEGAVAEIRNNNKELWKSVCNLNWIKRTENLAHKSCYNFFIRKKQELLKSQTLEKKVDKIKIETAGVNGYIDSNNEINFSMHGTPKDILKICNKIIEQILDDTSDLKFK